MSQLGLQPMIHPTAEVMDTTFGRYCQIGARSRLAECRFGDYSYIGGDCEAIHTEIGKFSSIAAAVRLNPGQHPMDRASLHHFQYRSALYGLGEDDAAFFQARRDNLLTIGHDSWIGHGVVIMGGLSIGLGAVIGAGAVVTQSVPDYTIVAGVPGRPLRERFPQEIQQALKTIAWWHWPHERIGEALHDFRTLSAEAFCRKHG
jgi:phosphonate metabolism protein (transferase hexapeptide repeat family)